MKNEYRTDDQWIHMCENAMNGNWTDAAEDANEFGFYANDMIIKFNEEEVHIIEATDIAIIIEMATKIRAGV